MYHRIGQIMPTNGQTPEYAQIYFNDTDFKEHLNCRNDIFTNLDNYIMRIIQRALHIYHPYFCSLMTTRKQ